VNAGPTNAPLASFEAKWADAHPEFGLALTFLREPARSERSAFGCLVFELEHAAFGIREVQPAAIKLQWWAEEFARAATGEARHPLTRVLSTRIARTSIPLARWQEVVIAALNQRDPEPAADLPALVENYARFYAPLADIEVALFEDGDSAGTARAFALARALRETTALPDALRDGRLPLPLDLLARHRLARGDLAGNSPEAAAALRDWLKTLDGECGNLARKAPPLSVVSAATLAAASSRARRAARASEPLAALAQAQHRPSIGTVWSAWRAARRSRG
jgi:phytoene synthase